MLFVSTAGPRATISHPRLVVLAQTGSKATLIQSYAGSNSGSDEGGVYFTNGVSRVVLSLRADQHDP